MSEVTSVASQLEEIRAQKAALEAAEAEAIRAREAELEAERAPAVDALVAKVTKFLDNDPNAATQLGAKLAPMLGLRQKNASSPRTRQKEDRTWIFVDEAGNPIPDLENASYTDRYHRTRADELASGIATLPDTGPIPDKVRKYIRNNGPVQIQYVGKDEAFVGFVVPVTAG